MFHLLSLSRPLGCSFSRRRCFACPLVNSEVLSPGQSRFTSPNVLTSLLSLTGLVRVCYRVGVSVGSGDVEVDIIYVPSMMTA